MPGASWDLDRVAAELSAAALDASRWTPALQRLTDAVGAVGTVLLPPIARRVAVISTDALEGPNQQYLEEGWSTRDERDRGIPIALRRGVAVDQDFATVEEIARSEYYNDFLGRHGLRWSAIMASEVGGAPWVTSIQRSSAQGPFVADEQTRLAALRGALSCAIAVSSEFRLARARGLAEAFDILGSAAAVLDWRGEIIVANRTAERTLTGVLRIARRRLVSSDPQAHINLSRLVGQVTSSLSGPRLRPPVPVPRTGCRPLLVYGVPLTGEALDVFSKGRGILVILDLDARPPPPEEALRLAFHLTAAEARLAQTLTSGASLGAAAEVLGIAKETARSQLKAIFAKTDASRQSELVALLARLVPDLQKR